jgi:hypothetical protein
MSGLTGPENSVKIDVFRPVRRCSFTSVHGVSVVNLWSVLETDPQVCRPEAHRSAFPSHGRGRRFNPYSAHHPSRRRCGFFVVSALLYPATIGRTEREGGNSIRGKSVDFVRDRFESSSRPVSTDQAGLLLSGICELVLHGLDDVLGDVVSPEFRGVISATTFWTVILRDNLDENGAAIRMRVSE